MRHLVLAGFERIYAAGVRAKNARFDRKTPRRLHWPVVSVGNLAVGGAGKTPLVILLARLLAEAGWSADALSRGYGRRGGAVERVDAAGDPARFGDEPVMIARAAQIPVFVGASRYHAGLLAERELAGGARHVHLLDDGFQHRKLARAVDIVAIHRGDLEGRLLPAGRLREPLASLKRADVIVLREEDSDLAVRLASYAKLGARFWRVRRRLSLDGSTSRLAAGQTPAAVFCAIARPEEFFQMLEAEGIMLSGRMAFRDHHRYTASDVEALRKFGTRCGAAAFITTEKDAVKLNAGLQEALAVPLHVARLLLEIADEPAATAQLVEMLESS